MITFRLIKKYLITGLIAIISQLQLCAVDYDSRFDFEVFSISYKKKYFFFFEELTVNMKSKPLYGFDLRKALMYNKYLRKIILNNINDTIVPGIKDDIIKYKKNKNEIKGCKYIKERFEAVNLRTNGGHNYYVIGFRREFYLEYYRNYEDIKRGSKYKYVLYDDYRKGDLGDIFLVGKTVIKIEDNDTLDKLEILAKYNDKFIDRLNEEILKEIKNFEIAHINHLSEDTDFLKELIDYCKNKIEEIYNFKLRREDISNMIKLGFIDKEINSRVAELKKEKENLKIKNEEFTIQATFDVGEGIWGKNITLISVKPQMKYGELI